ncbi:hypothetical protein [uncultured Algibacter sp.]|uniref:hypothetical protein n=1 Tax=uncultured Algibacter sp. TaxID=298659 RepID=UPI003216E864
MFKVQSFKNCETYKISCSRPVEEILNTIKNGDKHLSIIQKARTYKKGIDKEYDTIKRELLPTHRFNFQFNDYATNANITTSTGLIYIDADGIEYIPEHPMIYAKWKSLSNTGYGILVRVHNLNQYNFGDTYDDVGKWLNIMPDPNARKANQQTILSYDPNIHINLNSIVYTATTVSSYNDIKKVPSTYILKEEKEGMGVNGTIYEHTSYNTDSTYNNKLRFNNISDYFKDIDDTFLIFEDKIKICDPYIPRIITEGNRNNKMFNVLSQDKLLNPYLDYKSLKGLANVINKRMFPRLSDNEVHSIINSILKGFENGSLKMICNRERKFLFNPDIKLSHKEKMGVVNKHNGKFKSDKTKERIYEAIESWNFSLNKKITQTKVAELSGVSKRTVIRHWNVFKGYVKELNEISKQKG